MEALHVQTNARQEIEIDEQAVAELKRSIWGELLCPSDAAYDEARKVWNGMIDKHPAMIARCTGPADVAAAVQFAGERDLLLSVRGGGHNVAGRALCDDGLVVDLSRMRGVRVDPIRRTVRVEGGATLADIDAATQGFGLVVPVGLVGATGIGGLTLHGGMGWLTRKYGLTLDNLLSVDIICADSRLRRAGETDHADLFWAVRGGGGNFGVVTSFEFRAHPLGHQVWFLASMYPISQAKEVLTSVVRLMADAPEELGVLTTLWTAPSDDSIPAQHRGAPVIMVLGCYCGPFEWGDELTRPFRRIGEPIVDLSGPRYFIDVQRFFDDDYPDGMYYYWKSAYLTDVNDEAIDAMIGHAGTRPSPLTSLDFWFLGGAANRVPPDKTAYARRDAKYVLAIEANWTDPEQSNTNIAWAREVYNDMQRFTRGTYLNFPGFIEDSDTLLRDAYGPNYDRLRAIKARYDPDNLFHGTPNIPPGG